MAGRQTGGIYRLTVSVKTDLNRRMNEFKDEVNWSAVAAAAFEEKLAEINRLRRFSPGETIFVCAN